MYPCILVSLKRYEGLGLKYNRIPSTTEVGYEGLGLKYNRIPSTTGVGPREDPSQDYDDERYPAKKRRVSCGIEIVKCNICGYHFDSPAQLSDHLIHHDSDYRFNPIYK